MPRRRRFSVVLAGLLILSAASAACHRNRGEPRSRRESMTKRDINDVLRDHDDELLAIPGVVGVYVGLLDDEKTLCLKVMVERKSKELEAKIPKELGGYQVVIEETGRIRPMPRK
jgi:hypothetical protein